MSPRNRIITLLILDILCYRFGGYWIGVFSFFITLYKVLEIYGIIRKAQIFQFHFRPGFCYVKDAININTNLSKLLDEIKKMINEKQLNDFSIIVFYYDKLGEIKETEQNFSIGIYKKTYGDYEISDDKKQFLVKEGFRRHELCDAKSLYCCWDYYKNFTLKIGIRKFYNLIKTKIKSQNFMKAFNIKENQLKVAIEVYDDFFGNKKLQFFIPFENVDKFILDQKNK